MKKTVHSFLLILVLLLLPTAFASAVEAPPINEISDDGSFVEWFNFLRSDDYSFSYVIVQLHDLRIIGWILAQRLHEKIGNKNSAQIIVRAECYFIFQTSS